MGRDTPSSSGRWQSRSITATWTPMPAWRGSSRSSHRWRRRCGSTSAASGTWRRPGGCFPTPRWARWPARSSRAPSGAWRRLDGEIKVLLLPRDPNDERNVIIEIRSGVGGEESALFASSLYRMYSMYAEAKRWRTEVANLSDTGAGRHQGDKLHRRGPGGLFAAEVRVRGAPRAARAGDRGRRGAYTPARPPWRCCRRWTRWRWR